MAKKNATANTAAAIENAPEIVTNVEAGSDAQGSSLNETQTETPAEAKKRERNYSQSAINTADLDRLNGLKAFVKETLKVTISNQRIISAALDCLGDNVEAFLKDITDEINSKNIDKERKAYLELKAKFDAMDAAAATEESKEKVVEAAEEAAADAKAE